MIWIDSDISFCELVDRLCGVARFALDTEFHRERTYWPQLSLVQCGVDDDVYVVDALAVDVSGLSEVFGSEICVVIHAADQDLEILARATGTLPRRIFDTQLAASFLGYGTASLSKLLSGLIDVSLPKADRLTDWLRRPLPNTAIEYAAADVEHLIELHDEIRSRLVEAGRLEWALEECEDFRDRDRGPVDPQRAWWKLKGSRQLSGKSRGVAQQVTAWRESTAAKRNIPPRFVMSDLAVSSIAERPPRDSEQLRNVRGLDVRQLGAGGAAALLDSVASGSKLATGDLVTPPAHNGYSAPKPLVTLCAAYVAQIARNEGLDSALIATRDDISRFVRGDPSRLGGGWRHDLAGAPLGRLVQGDCTIGVRAQSRLEIVESTGDE